MPVDRPPYEKPYKEIDKLLLEEERSLHSSAITLILEEHYFLTSERCCCCSRTSMPSLKRGKAVLLGIVADGSQPSRQHLDNLSKEEHERYASFPSLKRQKEFFLGRLCAKLALRSLCKVEPLSSINIRQGIFGQPVVCHKDIYQTGISIAHSGKMALALAYEEAYPMACDVEYMDREKLATIETQLEPKELFFVQKDLLKRAFFLWSAKESLSKVLKTGLTLSFSLLETESVETKEEEELYQCGFKHFPQYIAKGKLFYHEKEQESYILTFVYPKICNEL